MTREEANTRIAEIIKEKTALFHEMKRLADDYALTVEWDGTYGSIQQKYVGRGGEGHRWNHIDRRTEYYILEEGEWNSSSDGC